MANRLLPKKMHAHSQINAEFWLGTPSRSPFENGISRRELMELVMSTKDAKIPFGNSSCHVSTYRRSGSGFRRSGHGGRRKKLTFLQRVRISPERGLRSVGIPRKHRWCHT